MDGWEAGSLLQRCPPPKTVVLGWSGADGQLHPFGLVEDLGLLWLVDRKVGYVFSRVGPP